jgi:hypothetical protein
MNKPILKEDEIISIYWHDDYTGKDWFGVKTSCIFHTRSDADKFAKQIIQALQENPKLKEHLEWCNRSPTFNKNYTSIGGSKRWNSCDNNCHLNECEHGDCFCDCHKLQQENQSLKQLEKAVRELLEKHRGWEIPIETKELQELLGDKK